ncbi:MAG: hypothetical protein JJU15_05445 [Pararhodobacter sp.]|nr:hypothetical protein [Pararhodobacter sp.]
MLETDLPELALAGDRGIDLFRRAEDENQRRVQYECIATAHPDADGKGRLEVHLPPHCKQPDRLWQAVERYHAAQALHHGFTFARPASYPPMHDPASRLLMFQCLEFFRVRMVADLTITRYEEKLAATPEQALRHYAETRGALKLLLDYNMLARARPIRDLAAPQIMARVTAPGFTESSDNVTGFSLRLLGDLYLRDAEPARALACFEASIQAADNPYRRRKAIEAAQAAGDSARCMAHIDSFSRWGRIPPDVEAMRPAPSSSGAP